MSQAERTTESRIAVRGGSHLRCGVNNQRLLHWVHARPGVSGVLRHLVVVLMAVALDHNVF